VKLTKERLKELIVKEINSAEKEYVISGDYDFMKKKALPVAKKLGIKNIKLYSAHRAFFEFTFRTDSKTFKKLNSALKKLDKSGEDYQGVFESKIYESSIEFDESKMKDLLKKDKFLQRAFKSIKGKEKEKLEKLFNTFIIDDSKMEKEYKKNWSWD